MNKTDYEAVEKAEEEPLNIFQRLSPNDEELGEKERLLAQFLEEQVSHGENYGVLSLEDMTHRDVEQLLRVTNQVNDYRRLMMYYACALDKVKTKLDALDRELSMVQNRNPFESIKSRIKSPFSVYEKMRSRGIPFSVENIERYLSDVAGIRVICSFIDDIYMLKDCLTRQDDITVLEEKDYIKKPKTNGYRSLHLILEIPIYLTNKTKHVRVEVQFRTIAMDFWAAVEHKMQYKQNIPNSEVISEELKYSAELINQLDQRMQQIRDRIDDSLGKTEENHGFQPHSPEYRNQYH